MNSFDVASRDWNLPRLRCHCHRPLRCWIARWFEDYQFYHKFHRGFEHWCIDEYQSGAFELGILQRIDKPKIAFWENLSTKKEIMGKLTNLVVGPRNKKLLTFLKFDRFALCKIKIVYRSPRRTASSIPGSSIRAPTSRRHSPGSEV